MRFCLLLLLLQIFHLFLISLTQNTYNEQGQLTCILCKSVVRSEAVWTVHVNAKQHKQNVELAKKLKQRTNNFTTPLKRPLTPPLPEVPEKKVKGILKNANIKNSNDSIKNGESDLPPDFFDNLKLPEANTHQKVDTQQELKDADPDALPEGFFDDPKLDAKVSKNLVEKWNKISYQFADDNKLKHFQNIQFSIQ